MALIFSIFLWPPEFLLQYPFLRAQKDQNKRRLSTAQCDLNVDLHLAMLTSCRWARKALLLFFTSHACLHPLHAHRSLMLLFLPRTCPLPMATCFSLQAKSWAWTHECLGRLDLYLWNAEDERSRLHNSVLLSEHIQWDLGCRRENVRLQDEAMLLVEAWMCDPRLAEACPPNSGMLHDTVERMHPWLFWKHNVLNLRTVEVQCAHLEGLLPQNDT